MDFRHDKERRGAGGRMGRPEIGKGVPGKPPRAKEGNKAVWGRRGVPTRREITEN